jgi:hypothetical protein
MTSLLEERNTRKVLFLGETLNYAPLNLLGFFCTTFSQRSVPSSLKKTRQLLVLLGYIITTTYLYINNSDTTTNNNNRKKEAR